MNGVRLAPDETAEGRPFTAPTHGAADLRIIERMVRRLAHHARTILAESPRATADDRRVLDDDGSLHRIVLPDIPSLISAEELAAVGFFGQARTGVDHTPIGDLEQQLISTMDGTDGLVAYYNVHWPTEGWGNVVLFADVAHRRGWGGDARHEEAVRRAPQHYRSVRLHHVALPGGLDGGAIRLTSTTFLDYADAGSWRATRDGN